MSLLGSMRTSTVKIRSQVNNYNLSVNNEFWPATELDADRLNANLNGNVSPTSSIDAQVEYIFDDSTNTTYLKGKFLGKGGFARVHELTDLGTSKVYAGKIIPKSSITKPHQREKIVREVELHRTLKHKNVVQFHHFFEDDRNVYIILERCPRKSLVHVLKKRRNFNELEVRFYMRQLVDGVRYIHGQSIIHRDLKLGNMFLTDDMVVKVGDFGLAVRSDNGQKKITICGTPNYIAPEVLNKEGHGFEADVWAMGCIMFAMLVGQPPFETATVKETYSRIASNNYRIPAVVSPQARALMTALLQPCPTHRPTLDQIAKHEFFSNYSHTTSKTTLTSTNIIESTKKLSISPVATKLPDASKMNNIFSVKMEMRSKEKDTMGLPHAIRQKITSVLCPEKFNNGRTCVPRATLLMRQWNYRLRSCTGKKTKACSATTLYHMLGTCFDNMPDEVSPALVASSCPVLFVTKWIDYSNKHGFGFQLSDKSVGVLFNDGYKMSFPPNKRRLEVCLYMGKSTSYPVNLVPLKLQYRCTLLCHFAQYMDENLTEGCDTKEDVPMKRKGPVPMMKRWVRTPTAIVMQLSTGTVQVNFIDDHTKIILGCDCEDYLVTYINEDRQSVTYTMVQLLHHGCPAVIRERLLYALKVLGEFADMDREDS